MPRAPSSLGTVAQSGQSTQCVRLETWAGTLVYLAANVCSWVSHWAAMSSGAGPDTGHEPNTGCSPTSKPCEMYDAAWALVTVAVVYTYDVARTHSHCATEQPAGLSVL